MAKSSGQPDETSLVERLREWLDIRPGGDTHFDILGIPFGEVDPDVIRHAYETRIAQLRKQLSGPEGELAKRCARYVKKIAECLLDPKRREGYLQSLLSQRPSSSAEGAAGSGRLRKDLAVGLALAVAAGVTSMAGVIAVVLYGWRFSRDDSPSASEPTPAVASQTSQEIAQSPQPVAVARGSEAESPRAEPEQAPTSAAEPTAAFEAMQTAPPEKKRATVTAAEMAAPAPARPPLPQPGSGEGVAEKKGGKKKGTQAGSPDLLKAEKTAGPKPVAAGALESQEEPAVPGGRKSMEEFTESVLGKMTEYRSTPAMADFRKKLTTANGRLELLRATPTTSDVERIAHLRFLEEAAQQKGDLPVALDAFNAMAALPVDYATMKKYAELNFPMLTRFFGARRDVSVQQYVARRAMPTLLYATSCEKTERGIASVISRMQGVAPDLADQQQRLRAYMKLQQQYKADALEPQDASARERAGLYYCMNGQCEAGLRLLVQGNEPLRAWASQMEAARSQGDSETWFALGRNWEKYARSLGGDDGKTAFVLLVDECYRMAMLGAGDKPHRQLESIREGLSQLKADWLYSIPSQVNIDLLASLSKQENLMRVEGKAAVLLENTSRGPEPMLVAESMEGKSTSVSLPLPLRRLPEQMRLVCEFKRLKGNNDIAFRVPILQGEDGSAFVLQYVLEHKASNTGLFGTGFTNLVRGGTEKEQVLMQEFGMCQTAGALCSLVLEVQADPRADSVVLDAKVFNGGQPTKLHSHFEGNLSAQLRPLAEMTQNNDLFLKLRLHRAAVSVHRLTIESMPQK